MKGMLRVTGEHQLGEQYLNPNISIVAAADPTDIADNVTVGFEDVTVAPLAWRPAGY